MIEIRKSYKYRVYPRKSQISVIEHHFRLCCEIYNWALEEKIKYYRETKKTLTQYEQQKLLLEVKERWPDFREVYAQCYIDILIRVRRAFENFFRRVKAGETPGFPNFKNPRNYSSMTRQCQEVRENFLISEDFLQFTTTIGPLWTRQPTTNKNKNRPGRFHRPIPENAELKTVTLLRENNKYFLAFSVVEQIKPNRPKGEEQVKIDLLTGVNLPLLTDSQKGSIEKPGYYILKEKELAKLHKRIRYGKDKDQKDKDKRKINKIYFRLKNRRRDFNWNLAKNYRDYKKIIVTLPELAKLVQEQDPEANKATLDATLYNFVLALQAKAATYGYEIEVIRTPQGEITP